MSSYPNKTLRLHWPAASLTPVPGLAFSALLGGTAMVLGDSPWLGNHGVSALTLAILLGLLAGNAMPGSWHSVAGPGINFSKQRLLRLGVVLYGFRLTLQDVEHIGLAGVLIDTLMLGSTFTIACIVGIRWLKLDRRTAMLIGIGSSICGAAAVIAAEPIVRGRPEQVTVAITTVVVFGTLAIFLYPALHALYAVWHLTLSDRAAFGVYAGSTVHEVAQVVAIGRNLGPESANAAVIVKMVRVMMLAPFLLGVSAWLARRGGEAGSPQSRVCPEHRHETKATVPWFACGFIAVVLFNSLHLLPPSATAAINVGDSFLLATAMAALGASTRIDAIRRAGARPLVLGLILFAWLVIGGAAINDLVMTSAPLMTSAAPPTQNHIAAMGDERHQQP